MCRSGLIEDPKLEIGVSRLLRLLYAGDSRKRRTIVRMRTIRAHF
jgi:hypothetical protein